MTIDIVGTGITAAFYGWPSDHEKWSVGSAFKSYGNKIDIYFCFHDEPVDHFIKSDIGYFDKHNYPLSLVVSYTGSSYFTNSIAYMIALAIKKKVKAINLWGVDLDAGREYEFERPCVAYWIGQAEARGIKVTSSSNLAVGCFNYGYDDFSEMLNQFEMRRKHAEVMAGKTSGREKDQWVGKMVAMRDAINIVRS